MYLKAYVMDENNVVLSLDRAMKQNRTQSLWFCKEIEAWKSDFDNGRQLAQKV